MRERCGQRHAPRQARSHKGRARVGGDGRTPNGGGARSCIPRDGDAAHGGCGRRSRGS